MENVCSIHICSYLNCWIHGPWIAGHATQTDGLDASKQISEGMSFAYEQITVMNILITTVYPYGVVNKCQNALCFHSHATN